MSSFKTSETMVFVLWSVVTFVGMILNSFLHFTFYITFYIKAFGDNICAQIPSWEPPPSHVANTG